MTSVSLPPTAPAAALSAPPLAAPTIIRPPHNCWRVERAERVAFLIDAEAYFLALRAAALKARHSIVIVGWDFDSRTPLPRTAGDDDLPLELGAFLDALVRRRRGLHAYVLDWDFVMLYATGRELLPAYKLRWRAHRHVHFHLDDTYPIGSSHHQKIVVIDDRIAFVGGIDLTQRRLDNPSHAADAAQRRDSNGVPYAPFHDVQMMVDGRAAAAVGELARERWLHATGRPLPTTPADPGHDPWPETVSPDIRRVPVAIARTQAQHLNRPAVREVKQLYLDTIAAAQHYIYIENQYLTAYTISEALIERLRAPAGPQIVIVSRLAGDGWLERNTMEVLRARVLQRLHDADAHGRLRVYYPHQEGLGKFCIQVHSKLMVVDDRFVRIGSSNLNNRSMGLDTECDLAVEATDAAAQRAIARFRDRLLAEHLGVTPDTVALAVKAHDGSLIDAIDSLHGNPRDLKLLQSTSSCESTVVSETMIVDPENPVSPDELVNELVPSSGHRPAGNRIAFAALSLLAIAALAGAWRWTPLSEYLHPDTLARIVEHIEASSITPIWILAAYIFASFTAIPITALIVATVLVFGPFIGFGYALAGSMLGAAITFGAGQLLGRRLVRRLAGRHVNELSKRLGRQGLWAVLALRILPVAPFTVVNVVAGASHIKLRDFLVGTFLGMTPGMFALTVFSDRLAAVLRDPSPTALAVLALVAGAIVAGAMLMHRWLTRRDAPDTTQAHA